MGSVLPQVSVLTSICVKALINLANSNPKRDGATLGLKSSLPGETHWLCRFDEHDRVYFVLEPTTSLQFINLNRMVDISISYCKSWNNSNVIIWAWLLKHISDIIWNRTYSWMHSDMNISCMWVVMAQIKTLIMVGHTVQKVEKFFLGITLQHVA